jgi:NADH-quinone oxidoreductase subunit L
VLAAFMTSFYSWRLMFMTFHQPARWGHAGDVAVAGHGHATNHKHDDHAHDEHGQSDHTPHESPLVMLIPLYVLAAGAVLAGAVFAKYFIGVGHGKGEPDPYKIFWGPSIFEGPKNHILHAMHEIPHWVGFAPFIAMLAGLGLAYVYYIRAPWLPEATAKAFRPLYLFFLNKWYIDELYDFLFVRPAFAIGRLLWKGGDGAIIDGTIDGTASTVSWVTGRTVKLQTGYVFHYAYAMLLGVAAILTYMIAGGIGR